MPDPYRLFFPLGVICGIAGVAIWPVYVFGWIETVSSAWHIDMQIQGFLFAFVLGFLATSLPRFTLSWHATWVELGLFSLLFVAGNAATAAGILGAGRILFAANLTALLAFAIRRFLKRKGSPPEEFALIGFGLLTGWVASMIRAVGALHEIPPAWEILARRLITEGMMMFLILGIGTRLAPLFWGIGSGTSPVVSIGKIESPVDHRRHRFFLLIGLLILASFGVEYLWVERAGLWIRALLTAMVFLGPMKLWKPARTRGVIMKTLRGSMVAVALTPWGAAFHPQFRVETLHVMFIAGFGIMILTIATRVILTHGNHPVEIEKNSPALFGGALLFLAAMVFRSVAALNAERYFPFLAVAGCLWITGLSIWGLVFSMRAIRIQPSPHP